VAKRSERERRAERRARERQRLNTRLSQVREIVRMGQECPDINQFIASLYTAACTRLLGIFRCPPEKYLATEAVLAMNGHAGYLTLEAEISGGDGLSGDGKGRGWAAAVKQEGLPDAEFKIFVGIVRPTLTGDSAEDAVRRWAEVISVVHELGHAHDMDQGVSFRLGEPLSIEEAELFAHRFACRLLRERRMTMGLTAYLSMAICTISDADGAGAAAARRFMASEEYSLSLQAIPRYVRRNFDIIEAT